MWSISLRSKRFLWRSRLENWAEEQKKMNDGGGGEAITRLETLATQASDQ